MRVLRALIAALLIGSAAITPAFADDAYRYWSYWNADAGAWQYAKFGPAMTKAKDGGVDGWRYGVGTLRSSTPPSIAPDFNAICGNTVAGTDQVRVAVVIDFGTGTDAPAPRSACAVVAAGLTRASALTAVAPLRLNQGFVCGIDNYPQTGCSENAAAPTTTPTATPTARSAATSAKPTTPEAATTEQPIVEPAAVEPSASPSTVPSTPTMAAEMTVTGEDDSLLPSIVTGILAIVVLLLALRNARIQQEARHK